MSRIIPLEDFFRSPERIHVRLSPNGEYLSWMEPYERRLNIFVKNLKTNEIKRVTQETLRDIDDYLWANDERLIYGMDTGGDENTRLYGVLYDGGSLMDYTPFENVKSILIDDLENDPDHVLMQMNQRDPSYFDVYRLNVHTGEMTLIAENPGNILGWLTDHDSKLRVAVTSDGVNNGIMYRETEDGEWNEVADYNFKESAMPLFFTPDNKALYVSSNVGRDKRAIFEYDLNTGKEGKLIYENSEVDVQSLLYSQKRKVITGVSFETDRVQRLFFDEFRKKIQDFIDAKLPGYENSIVGSDRDEIKYIIHSGNDRIPGSYYFLDAIKWELTKLFDLYPWINEPEMAEMKPIKYISRDGLEINGYLTLPVGMEPKNLPVVINPHGGPWHRDSWGFNPEVQFMANRGYAVLQMNFRGSTGYGKKFWELSFKQWGLTMQDDITDAVHWIIDQGIADPKKIAIYGASYGGYATLMGVVKTPDLYAAAIDYVGISKIATFQESIPSYWEPMREMLYEMTGHPDHDLALMEAASPALHADKIRTPLFIAQGANDPRVKKAESDQMVAALQARGIEVEYMVKDNEGHGFGNEENKFDFYRAMEKFLSTYIG